MMCPDDGRPLVGVMLGVSVHDRDCCDRYSARIPAVLMIGVHFVVSSRRNFPRSPGEPPPASNACVSNASTTSRDCSSAANDVLSRATTSAGVPVGAKNACQESTITEGSCSDIETTSGAKRDRRDDDTASA